MSVTATVKLWVHIEGWVRQGGLPAVWMGHPEIINTLDHTFACRPSRDDKVTLATDRWGRVSEVEHTSAGALVVSVRMHDETSLKEATGAVQAEEAKPR